MFIENPRLSNKRQLGESSAADEELRNRCDQQTLEQRAQIEAAIEAIAECGEVTIRI